MKDNAIIITMVLGSLLLLAWMLGHGLNADNYQFFLSLRFPKLWAMLLAAVAVAQSSLVFQTITHNRILTPSIMGFDGLYLLTQVLVVVTLGVLSPWLLDPFANFTLTLAVMAGFSLLLFRLYFKQQGNLMVLLLIGVVLGQLFSNVASFMTLVLDPNDFATVQSKMFASFSNIKTELVALATPLLLVISWAIYRQHRRLDILWLDKDNAIGLGVDVKKITRQMLIYSSVLVALSTAMVGPVMFFGLLVTNLTREMLQSYRHQHLLLACSLTAIFSLLLGQWLIESVFHFSTTLSVVINFIGGVYFLSMLLRNKFN